MAEHAPATQIDDAAWHRAAEAIESAESIALACHVGPDGDALGSMLALGLGLRGLGKAVVASWGSEPFEVPAMYSFLPGQELLVPVAEFPPAPTLLVTFDTGSLDRLGALAPHAEKAERVVVVDHHASNTGYGDLHLVDSSAAASAVVVEELLRRLGAPLTPEIATCLYTGLTTDTGSFKFSATTPAVHELAARLLATGIAHDEISRTVWDTNRFNYLRLLGELLERTRLERPYGLVWTVVFADDLDAFGVRMDEIEGVIDVIRTTAESEVAVVFKQEPDRRWAVSMRSKGRVDVGAIAVGNGGGGHRFAAGFTSDVDYEYALARLRDALRGGADG
ncbi:MAG: bifunctional oligoribonuclease/PAP phosphatase NrnA [Mycobacteriales bacterium]